MNDPLADDNDGTTPLADDEAQGLRLTWVRTRGDLNEAEAANIVEARRTIRRPSTATVLDDLWLRRLHRRMFGDVWTWAGTYRRSSRNIGIEWPEIPAAVRTLVEDCRTWISFDGTVLPVARFHHRLVLIHPFPNGNGRHARAAADYLARAMQLQAPSWGAGVYDDTKQLRTAYLAALRAADRDRDDLAGLVAFMWASR